MGSFGAEALDLGLSLTPGATFIAFSRSFCEQLSFAQK
jgi:hypothetical protein